MVPDHPEPVATTWSLSFTQVQAHSVVVADLLRVCAFLHPDVIPEEILTEGAPALGSELQASASSPVVLNQAIGVLLAYSLLKRQPEEHLLSMHRLVQVVRRMAWTHPPTAGGLKRVVQVNQALPQDVDYGPSARYKRRFAHAQECARLIEQEQFTSFAAVWLLYKTGRYLYDHARYDEAEAFWRTTGDIGGAGAGP